MSDAPIYTAEELAEFDRITNGLCSLQQLVRIAARMEIKGFVEEHGKPKCDAMFADLQARDAKRGRNRG